MGTVGKRDRTERGEKRKKTAVGRVCQPWTLVTPWTVCGGPPLLFLQMMSFPMTANSKFPWANQQLTSDMVKVFSFLESLNLLALFPMLRVYLFIFALLWIAALLLCAAWVARCFVNNHFPFLWPVKVRCGAVACWLV